MPGTLRYRLAGPGKGARQDKSMLPYSILMSIDFVLTDKNCVCFFVEVRCAPEGVLSCGVR